MNNGYTIAFPARDAFYNGLDDGFYREYSEFRNVFDIASDFIREDLRVITYDKPGLRPELHTVCLVAHCIALYGILTAHRGKPVAAIGFSQGEFAAASAAGSVSFPEVLGLVYSLEALLSNNLDIRKGIMVRVVGLDREALKECCDSVDPSGKSITVAITYTTNQNVVSGDAVKVKELSDMAKQRGARWVIPLNSGGAFHSALCRSILPESDKVFETYEFKNASYPVFSCLDGDFMIDGTEIKKKLSQQIAAPVKWDKLIGNHKKYIGGRIIELAGSTVSGNTRIVDDDIPCEWINNVFDLENQNIFIMNNTQSIH